MYKTVLEERLYHWRTINIGQNLTAFQYRDFILNWAKNQGMSADSTVLLYDEAIAMKLYEENNGKNYVISNDFYRAMSESCKRLKIDTIPVRECFNSENRTYQVTIPETKTKFILDFHGDPDDEFNITIFKFVNPHHAIDTGIDDFMFWKMRCKSSDSCEEALDSFMVNANLVAGNIDSVRAEIRDMFNEIINIMLYINCGEPDIREFSPPGTDQPKAKLKKYIRKNGTAKPYTSVGFSFKKETLVNSFFRWQPYGPNNSLRRYQLIPGFPRKAKD